MENRLRNQRHIQYLDAVQLLKKAGREFPFSLPQIVVCGDQSAGKSSVLEAISGGVPFPTSDGLCTRYPTQIVLRNAPNLDVTATIIPDPNRKMAEQRKLQEFKMTGYRDNVLAEIIAASNKLIGTSSDLRHRFSHDVLQIEIFGPGMSDLTITDLPGLFLTFTQAQSTEEAEFVKEMVKNHIRDDLTLIIAVVHAKVGLEMQEVMNVVHQVDPEGKRTLGIITKPDTLNEHEEPVRFADFIQTARNIHRPLHLGWHVLRNRSHSERGATKKERDRTEASFFKTAQGWKDLPAKDKGIEALDKKLSVLSFSSLDHNAANLKLKAEALQVQLQLQLQQLEAKSTGIEATKKTLANAVVKFAVRMNSLWYEAANTNNPKALQLQKNIQACVTTFTAGLSIDDYISTPLVTGIEDIDGNNINAPTQLELEIERRLKANPHVVGQIDMKIVSDLFYERAISWVTSLEQLVREVTEVAEQCVHHVVQQVLRNKSELLPGVQKHILNPSFAPLKHILSNNVEGIIAAHNARGELLPNPQLSSSIQSARAKSVCDMALQCLNQTPARPYLFTSSAGLPQEVDTRAQYIENLQHLAMETDSFAIKEIAAYTDAHYQAELQNLRNLFSLENLATAVRECLEGTFTMEQLEKLNEEQLTEIAGSLSIDPEKHRQLEYQLSAVVEALQILANILSTSSV